MARQHTSPDRGKIVARRSLIHSKHWSIIRDTITKATIRDNSCRTKYALIMGKPVKFTDDADVYAGTNCVLASTRGW